jgi:hypothetical protein
MNHDWCCGMSARRLTGACVVVDDSRVLSGKAIVRTLGSLLAAVEDYMGDLEAHPTANDALVEADRSVHLVFYSICQVRRWTRALLSWAIGGGP